MDYDIIIIGSGPGGYVAAIRAAQLGLKTAIVEKNELGGVCLNWGCIPTKSLLKSAQVFDYVKHASDYGVIANDAKPDFERMITRSRGVAENMSKGIQFLLKKNKIDVIKGHGKLKSTGNVEVTSADGEIFSISATHIILATGAKSKQLPGLLQDGTTIIGYREAMTLSKQPSSMIVIGSGAIGCEFANFYQSIGTNVTLVEFQPRILPLEDEEVSKQLDRSFRKLGMKVMTSSSVENVQISNNVCQVLIKTGEKETVLDCDIVFSAVGISPNIENIGIEELGILTERGKIKVDDYYATNIEGIYAIGDIVRGPALAHVASAEGICCVEKIAGLNPQPIDYENIPSCTYTLPEVASVGMNEQAARNAGYDVKVGKFPFTASGKASASGAKDGFAKLVFDAKTDQLLGASLIGQNVTEMIAELVIARKFKVSGNEIIKTIHPHPTMSEAIMEAAAAAYGEVIHL
jgi:dihydrolipoamide dehydrogenase